MSSTSLKKVSIPDRIHDWSWSEHYAQKGFDEAWADPASALNLPSGTVVVLTYDSDARRIKVWFPKVGQKAPETVLVVP